MRVTVRKNSRTTHEGGGGENFDVQNRQEKTRLSVAASFVWYCCPSVPFQGGCSFSLLSVLRGIVGLHLAWCCLPSPLFSGSRRFFFPPPVLMAPLSIPRGGGTFLHSCMWCCQLHRSVLLLSFLFGVVQLAFLMFGRGVASWDTDGERTTSIFHVLYFLTHINQNSLGQKTSKWNSD